MKLWPFRRKQTDVQALIADLLERLDAQDEQLHRIEQATQEQGKRVDKVIRRIDRATGRDIA